MVYFLKRIMGHTFILFTLNTTSCVGNITEVLPGSDKNTETNTTTNSNKTSYMNRSADQNSTETLTVKFTSSTPKASAAGHLEGWNENDPSDDLFPFRSGLTLARHFGAPDYEKNVMRSVQLGYTPVIRLEDYRDRCSQMNPSRLMPYNDWALWESYVSSRANTYGNSAIYDVWNEPLLPSEFDSGGWEQYCETYKRAHDQLVATFGAGNFQITGPSLRGWYPTYIESFLNYCKNHSLTVTYLNWHEIYDWSVADHGNFAAITDHLNYAREHFLNNSTYRKLGIQKIGIYESFYTENAGDNLATFYALEAGNADAGAVNSCWNSDCENASFSGLLTHDSKAPRSSWYVWDEYGRGLGTRVLSETTNAFLPVLGSKGDGQSASLLVGNAYTDSRTVTIKLNGLNALPFLGSSASQIQYDITYLPNSGDNAATTGFELIQTEVASIQSHSIQINTMELQPQGVYKIILTNPSGAVTPSSITPTSGECSCSSSLDDQILNCLNQDPNIILDSGLTIYEHWHIHTSNGGHFPCNEPGVVAAETPSSPTPETPATPTPETPATPTPETPPLGGCSCSSSLDDQILNCLNQNPNWVLPSGLTIYEHWHIHTSNGGHFPCNEPFSSGGCSCSSSLDDQILNCLNQDPNWVLPSGLTIYEHWHIHTSNGGHFPCNEPFE